MTACVLCRGEIHEDATVCPHCSAYAVETPTEILWYRAGEPGWNGKAIAAFVLSLLWLWAVGSIIAFVLAVLALREISRGGSVAKGQVLAMVAQLLAVIGVLVPLGIVASVR